MLLILLSWLYILAISSSIGVGLNTSLKLKNQDSIITLFFGFFGVTLIASIWAIPFAIDGYFQLFLLFISGLLFFLNYKNSIAFWKLLQKNIFALSSFFKILLAVITVLILAQSASPPFVIDNESYYIQTIKWLNAYGFVNGLVNLHVFLGQTSGWHILQSAFNFSFIYDKFNDLSALALLLGNVYAIIKLNDYIAKKDSPKSNLIFGLFPLFNVFFFQFISAPSPDIAIYVLSFIVLHSFVLCFKSYTKHAFISVVLLSLFMVYIKLTALPFLLFCFVLYKRFFVFTRSITSIVFLYGSLTILLLVIKNSILTGNVIFPLQGIESLKFSWSLPKNIEIYFSKYMQPYAYHLDAESFEKATLLFKLKTWLFAPIPYGFFNLLMLVLLLVIPFVIRKKSYKAFWFIYTIAFLNLFVLLLTSPQYRFFFPFILCFSLLIASLVLIHKNTIKVTLIFCTILPLIPLFFKPTNSFLTQNKHHQVSSLFSSEYIIQPFKNSKYSNGYNTIQLDKTTIYTPTEVDFFWGTGDIPLPALNQEQLDFFKTHFKVIPQQRSEYLKDGFYFKNINN